jgi:histidyl-tRNA synthetase
MRRNRSAVPSGTGSYGYEPIHTPIAGFQTLVERGHIGKDLATVGMYVIEDKAGVS